MDEIAIPKRAVFLAIFLAILIAAALGFAPQLQRRLEAPSVSTPTQAATTPPNDTASQGAAVAGAQAFYTVDAQNGQQDWLNRLCAVSTQTGCVVYQNTIGPALWPSLEKAQTSTTAKVTVQEKAGDPITASPNNNLAQVWRVQIELSAPWPMQKEPKTVFSALALVIQEQGVWKFERFLSEEELSAFSQAGGKQ